MNEHSKAHMDARAASRPQSPFRGFAVRALASAALIMAGAPLGQAAIYNVDETTTAAFGTVNQANVPPGNGVNSCAPTATMNSFTWLANAYPGVYGNTLMGGQANWQAAAALLAGPAYMKTSAITGTSLDDWATGKAAYLNNFAPGKTTFAGMSGVGVVAGQGWLQGANPTANFLLQQLQQGEDIEIGITKPASIGHVLTVTGISWNDANNNMVFDAGDTLTLNTIDPANPGVNTPLPLTAGGLLGVGGAYNGYSLSVAMAESPVPEASTTISAALMLGFTLISVLRKYLKAGAPSTTV